MRTQNRLKTSIIIAATFCCTIAFGAVSCSKNSVGSDDNTPPPEIDSVPNITVLSPNGGEKWYPGTTQEITWECDSSIDSVRVEWFGHGFRVFIARVAASQGRVDWEVPNSPQGGCQVRVTAFDKTVSDESDRAFTITGVFAYVADVRGLKTINVTLPEEPRNGLVVSGSFWDVVVDGEKAYALGDGQLHVLSLKEPQHPVVIGQMALSPWGSTALAIQDEYVYTVGYDSVFLIIDVSSPSAPIVVKQLDLPSIALDVVVSGNYAYIANYSRGVAVIDITRPTEATLLGHAADIYIANGVAIKGDHVFVANYFTFESVDVTDPADPTSVSSVRLPRFAVDVCIIENHAFVANGPNGLNVFDISNPASPTIVGQYTASVSGPGPHRVASNGSYLFAAQMENGLGVFDINNPTTPTLIYTFKTGLAQSRAVAVLDFQ